MNHAGQEWDEMSSCSGIEGCAVIEERVSFVEIAFEHFLKNGNLICTKIMPL